MCVSVPDGWLHDGRVAPQEEVELTFALKQQNVDRLQELLAVVSDPDSQHYGTESVTYHSLVYTVNEKSLCHAHFLSSSCLGKFLTLEEVASLVRPSQLTEKVVQTWLQSHGVTRCHTVLTRDFLQCSMTIQ